MATILIVDDRPTNREYFVTLLAYDGHRLLEAATGEEALAAARAERPDLILADIVMPVMDGYEFARQVRTDPLIAQTPIIFCTSSYIVAETQRLAQACGVAHVIAKPAEPQDILDVVHAALSTNEILPVAPVPDEFHREHMRLLTDTLANKVEELDAEIAERMRSAAALLGSEQRYRGLFENSPVALWEEDFSLVKQRLDVLRRQGVTDFLSFFTRHPEVVAECARLIRVIDINHITLKLYEAGSKDELLRDLDQIFGPETDSGFQHQLVSMADGQTDFGWDGVNRTLAGKQIFVSLRWSTFPGYEQNLARVIVSTVDITQRKRAEAELERRLAELEAVNQVSRVVRTAQTLDEMLPVWLDVTLAVMQATGGSIWLYDSAKDELQPAVTRGWREPAGAGPVRPQKPGVGIDGHVFVTGQPYLSRDFRGDPRVPEEIRERIPPGGGAAIPIPVGDKVIGTFVVNLSPGREVKSSEVRLLTTLVEIAGSAIHRLRLHEQTEQRLQRLAGLRAIDQAITSSLDLRVTLMVLLEQVVTQLRVDAAAVLLLNPHTKTLEFAAGRGLRAKAVERFSIRLGQGYAGRTALERRLVSLPDLALEDPDLSREALLTGEGIRAYHGVPLIAKGSVQGVLEVLHRTPLFPDPDWLDFLEALAGQAAIAIDNTQLFDELQRSNVDLGLAYEATIEGWSRALDLRDKETEGHTQRVTEMTLKLARAIGIGEEELVQIRRGALLHDIGKMGVPDPILLKPGPLTADEWTIMRRHPALAYEMLSPIRYLHSALDIPYCHHEKWDGTGYPRELKGDAIPLSARIFAVVDVWDALRSDRPYRAAWPEDTVRGYIRDQAGRHFDPAVVQQFLPMNWADGH